MPRFHHRGPDFGRRGGPFKGMFWLIALGVFFFSGMFRSRGEGISLFPGILILIGVIMVISTVIKNSRPPEAPPRPDFDWERPEERPVRPAPVRFDPPVRPAPASNSPRVDLLPATCPRCGAPVRSNEIKWTNSHSATCAYCGSTINAKS